ncbi:hypothetical protein F4553_005276 [Allocatelliglobosispora scoriae]|uniref:DGQHR domain-containing protein n=1 Tax=Allocatelliglobosispora scoriae TaxID=643052 RepID=A0A841BS67_9ACTN|nr:hypothetical protein [Allocatelliglobosispora scoriae]MBB5871897.1 hypothetical protein [Allocatelliglobosispora scoriae]
MAEFRYQAYRMHQTDTGKPLVLFTAPATDIEQWAGVPQRRRLDDRETFGFQREVKDSRVDEIAAFFRNPRNVVQNPLLAAIQSETSVRFAPSEDHSPFGELIINSAGIEALPFLEMLKQLAKQVRERVPILADYEVPQGLVDQLYLLAQARYNTAGPVDADEPDELAEEDIPESEESNTSEFGSVLLSEETNIVEFYADIQARITVLERITSSWDRDEFLGFTKEAILAYLLPVVLVDGQHRLRGAVQAAAAEMESDGNRSEIYAEIAAGTNADEVQAQSLQKYSRRLPVSLLMDASPSEHVFQFVVVNQKATPMAPALLGTIVSTSLGAEELKPIAQRLRDAKIKLEDSRAIAYLTRASESPFRGLVQTGMGGDRTEYLQWTVLQGLVRIFREFTGGRLYGWKNDYASIWCQRYLSQCALVAEVDTYSEKKELWGRPDGPWRDIFIRFFTCVRDYFGDVSDMGASNAWGNTRGNLFNKVSLTILSADYFEFLVSREETLDTVEDVDRTFEAWLKGTNAGYFNRDWKLASVKKDSIKVRNKWATLWFEYRRNPNTMPAVREFGA